MRLDPRLGGAWWYRALGHDRKGEIDAALAAGSTEEGFVLLLRGDMFRARGEHARAAEDYTRDPSLAPAIAGKARLTG